MSCWWGPRLNDKSDSQSKVEKAGNSADLVAIGLEYAGLQLRLRSLMEHQRRTWPGSAWTEELERQWSRKLDPIRDRMAALQWKAVDLPATDLRELKAKATILLEVTDDDPNNICAQLALSLCDDLILFSESADQSNRVHDLEGCLLRRKERATTAN